MEKFKNCSYELKMNDIVEDLVKLFLSCTDSYNPKICQTVNDKYKIVDKAMLTSYLFVKIMEDRNEKNDEVTKVLKNYLLKQVIYSETGNIVFEIENKEKAYFYNEILDSLVLKKFEYKNRILKELKYNYEIIPQNKYFELLIFLENIAELSLFNKLLKRGNNEAELVIKKIKEKINNYSNLLNNKDYFYNEKKQLIDLVNDNNFFESTYGNLNNVALNLIDVNRFSYLFLQVPENVMLHTFLITVSSIVFAEYCKETLKDDIDIYQIISKALFHDFGEFKGVEIISHFKYYNELSTKMFAEIEENDQKDLEKLIGTNLYDIISNYKKGLEGYIVEEIDKITGIMKLLVEVKYYNNFTLIKTINAIYQERFKRFLRIDNIDGVSNKKFYMDFLRESYIYIKEGLVEKDLNIFLNYYTEKELKEFRNEIEGLKKNPDKFLK